MDEECKTVLIETPAGPTRINATDFDAEKHKLAGEEAPAFKSINGYGLTSNGKRGQKERFIIVDAAGEAVTVEGVDLDGYKTQDEAAIIMQMLPPVV